MPQNLKNNWKYSGYCAKKKHGVRNDIRNKSIHGGFYGSHYNIIAGYGLLDA